MNKLVAKNSKTKIFYILFFIILFLIIGIVGGTFYIQNNFDKKIHLLIDNINQKNKGIEITYDKKSNNKSLMSIFNLSEEYNIKDFKIKFLEGKNLPVGPFILDEIYISNLFIKKNKKYFILSSTDMNHIEYHSDINNKKSFFFKLDANIEILFNDNIKNKNKNFIDWIDFIKYHDKNIDVYNDLTEKKLIYTSELKNDIQINTKNKNHLYFNAKLLKTKLIPTEFISDIEFIENEITKNNVLYKKDLFKINELKAEVFGSEIKIYNSEISYDYKDNNDAYDEIMKSSYISTNLEIKDYEKAFYIIGLALPNNVQTSMINFIKEVGIKKEENIFSFNIQKKSDSEKIIVNDKDIENYIN